MTLLILKVAFTPLIWFLISPSIVVIPLRLCPNFVVIGLKPCMHIRTCYHDWIDSNLWWFLWAELHQRYDYPILLFQPCPIGLLANYPPLEALPLGLDLPCLPPLGLTIVYAFALDFPLFNLTFHPLDFLNWFLKTKLVEVQVLLLVSWIFHLLFVLSNSM